MFCGVPALVTTPRDWLGQSIAVGLAALSMLEYRKASRFQLDDQSAANRRDLDRARPRGLRREGAARALRAAGEALARGAVAGGAGGRARRHWRAGGAAQDARAAALALALRARSEKLRSDDQRVEGAARPA